MNLLSKSLIAIILMLYVFFGIKHSTHQGFWHDEIYTFTFLKGVSVYDFEGSVWTEVDSILSVKNCKELLGEDKFLANFSQQILHEGHPPLYFIILKVWSYCFGSTELALRSFSLFCGILIFLVFFNIFQRYSRNKATAWGVFIILILNPYLFYFFTEARMYALALLFATLSFSFWLKYKEVRKLKSYSFLFFCLSSIALLYTHYYGIFFLSSLVFYELLNYGLKKSIFNHSIVFLCFLPWGLVIKRQLVFHEVHWTDGAVSFFDSIIGYFKGFANLLVSPIGEPLQYEIIIIFSILIIIIFFLILKCWKFVRVLLGVFVFYGFQIFLFDQLVDHHSILVPRYYLFVLVFIYWTILKAIDVSFKIPALTIVIIYSIVSSIVLIQLYQLERVPKQMYRELASYLDHRLDPNKKVLIFEPKGPLAFGVAYYLKNNFKMIPADKAPKNLGESAVYIDEVLGVAYRESLYHDMQQKELEFVPFVGINLYK